MNNISSEELLNEAKEARKNSYSPYSNYKVGAALLCEDGSIYKGCNVENAAYTPTVCAERVAFFKALSEGKRNFSAIAIVGGKKEIESCTPCGVCRQVMSEFCHGDSFKIIFIQNGEIKTMLLSELLPNSFSPLNLK